MTRKSALARLSYLDGFGEPNPDDPYQSLGVALHAVIEHAVANALASLPTPAKGWAGDVVGAGGRREAGTGNDKD